MCLVSGIWIWNIYIKHYSKKFHLVQCFYPHHNKSNLKIMFTIFKPISHFKSPMGLNNRIYFFWRSLHHRTKQMIKLHTNSFRGSNFWYYVHFYLFTAFYFFWQPWGLNFGKPSTIKFINIYIYFYTILIYTNIHQYFTSFNQWK